MNQPKTSPSPQAEHLFSNRQLASMLFPLMAEQLLITMMGMVNTFMVAHVGSYAISAVALVDSINILVIQAFYALGAGGTIVCAQYLGQKKVHRATHAAEQTLFIITLISIGAAALCILFDRPLLRLIFGAVDEEVFSASRTYFFLSALSYPFIALYDSGSSIFRAQENTRFPMAMSAIANVANILGNVVLVLMLNMGVAGAALSTLAARALCAILVLHRLSKSRKGQPIHISRYRKIRPHTPLIRQILRIGIPAGIENSMFQFGKLAIQSSVSTLGVTAMAAHAMASNFEAFNGIAGIGVGIGLMTVTGHCLGAGRKDEAVYYVKKFSVIAELAVAASCLLLFLLARPIVTLSGMEPNSMALFLGLLTLITIVKPIIWVPSFIPAYALRSAGDVKYTMAVSCLSMWLCRVSLCIFLIRVMHVGPVAVWIGMFSDWLIRGIFFTKRFRSRKWLEFDVLS